MKRYTVSGVLGIWALLAFSAGAGAQVDVRSYDWQHTHTLHERLRVESQLELPRPPDNVQHFDTHCEESLTTRYCFFRVQRFPPGAFKQCVALALELIAGGVRGELMQGKRFLQRYHGQVDCGGPPGTEGKKDERPIVEFNFEPGGEAFLLIWVSGEGIRITQNSFLWP